MPAEITSPLRIAVLSDTHDRLRPETLAALAGADEIWHLGDVCHEGLILELAALGVPVEVVRGNCDREPHWPLQRILERGGWIFHLEHIPPRRPPLGCDFLLHGHTHVPRDETVGDVRVLNPGSASGPRQGSSAGLAWLIVPRGSDRQPVLWERIKV